MENIRTFNVGDRVKCVDSGHIFSTYKEWVEQLCPEYNKQYLKSEYSAFVAEEADANGVVGTIRCIGKHVHGYYEGDMALVETESGEVFLIHCDGIEATDE